MSPPSFGELAVGEMADAFEGDASCSLGSGGDTEIVGDSDGTTGGDGGGGTGACCNGGNCPPNGGGVEDGSGVVEWSECEGEGEGSNGITAKAPLR